MAFKAFHGWIVHQDSQEAAALRQNSDAAFNAQILGKVVKYAEQSASICKQGMKDAFFVRG